MTRARFGKNTLGKMASALGALGAMGLLICALGGSAFAAQPGDVIISEINWAGSPADGLDEWVELFNTTDADIDMSNWVFGESNNMATTLDSVTFPAGAIIPAGGFLLLVAKSGAALQDVCADATVCIEFFITSFSFNLGNAGEQLVIQDGSGGQTIDAANQPVTPWFAGMNAGANQPRFSMERNDPSVAVPDGTVATSWHTNDGVTRNGLDSGGNPVNGTPGAPNSGWAVVVPLDGGVVEPDGGTDGGTVGDDAAVPLPDTVVGAPDLRPGRDVQTIGVDRSPMMDFAVFDGAVVVLDGQGVPPRDLGTVADRGATGRDVSHTGAPDLATGGSGGAPGGNYTIGGGGGCSGVDGSTGAGQGELAVVLAMTFSLAALAAYLRGRRLRQSARARTRTLE